jgi:hypothetical protein
MVEPLLGSDLGTASCCDEDRDRARADRPPESLIDRDALGPEGFTLVRCDPVVERPNIHLSPAESTWSPRQVWKDKSPRMDGDSL